MQVTKLKSGSIYEDKRNYARAVVAGDWIFVSNSAGRNYQTRAMSEDAAEQTRQCFHNIEAALAAVGSKLADVVRIRIAIPYVEYREQVMDVVGAKLQGVDPALTVTATPLMAKDYKVEIEVTALRGASAAPAEYLRVAI